MLTAQGMSYNFFAVPGCLVMQAANARITYVVSDPLTDLSRGWSLWLHYGGKTKTATPLCLHFSVTCMDKSKCGCLSTELMVCLSKTWHVLWSVLNVFQNDPPSTRMDGPCVKFVKCALCSVSVLMRCLLCQPLVRWCSISPK